MTTAERIVKLFADYQAVEPRQVRSAKNLESDLKMDSLDMVFMTQMVEEEFDVQIGDIEAAECFTLADIVALVERKLNPINPYGSGPEPIGPREDAA